MLAGRRVTQMLIGAVVLVAAVAVTALLSTLGVFAGTPDSTATPAASSDNVTVNAVAASPNTITVVGNGQVNVPPNQAQVDIGVTAERATVNAALNAANVDMTRLLASLRAHGIANDAIQTSNVSISQDRGCCSSVVVGYDASNDVTVTIHHIANVGPVISAAVTAVGNDINLNGVTFGLSDDSSQLSAARIAAVADARVRAGQWAAQTGRALGPILAVSEVVSDGGSPCTDGCGGAGGGVPVASGETNVSVSVTVVFKLS